MKNTKLTTIFEQTLSDLQNELNNEETDKDEVAEVNEPNTTTEQKTKKFIVKSECTLDGIVIKEATGVFYFNDKDTAEQKLHDLLNAACEKLRALSRWSATIEEDGAGNIIKVSYDKIALWPKAKRFFRRREKFFAELQEIK